MERKEVARELGVWPWNVDEWLLRGCPAKKLITEWDLYLEKVNSWLKNEKVRIKKTNKRNLRPPYDQGWFLALYVLTEAFPGQRQEGFIHSAMYSAVNGTSGGLGIPAAIQHTYPLKCKTLTPRKTNADSARFCDCLPGFDLFGTKNLPGKLFGNGRHV